MPRSLCTVYVSGGLVVAASRRSGSPRNKAAIVGGASLLGFASGGLADPAAWQVLRLIGLIVAVVIFTALFGSDKRSDRAFRLIERRDRGPGPAK